MESGCLLPRGRGGQRKKGGESKGWREGERGSERGREGERERGRRRERGKRGRRRKLLSVASPVASVVAALFLGVVQDFPEYRRPCHPSLLLLLPAAARHPQSARRQQEGGMMPKTRRRRRQGENIVRMRRPATHPRNHCRVGTDDPHEQGCPRGQSHCCRRNVQVVEPKKLQFLPIPETQQVVLFLTEKT